MEERENGMHTDLLQFMSPEQITRVAGSPSFN